MFDDAVSFAVEMYTRIAETAFPVACVFAIGNFMVNTLLSVAFGGRMTLGGGGKNG